MMPAPGASQDATPRWARLQAGLGAVPLAGFLIVHLLMQAPALWGPGAYTRVALLARPSWVYALGSVLVYLPLLVHAVLGIRRLAQRGAEPGGPGAVRLVQRGSAALLFVFLLFHTAQFPARRWTHALVPADYYPELCASLSSTAWGGVPLVAIGYLIGLAAAAVHGALGLYSAGLSFGLIGAARRRLWRWCCGALGVGLFGLGALIVIDLATGSVLIHLRGS